MYKVISMLMLALGLSGGVITTQKETPSPTRPQDQHVLFANYNPGDKPADTRGGWRIGGVNGDGAEAVAIMLTPDASGLLKRVEVFLNREHGSGNVIGYLMTDKQGPGEVLASFLLSAPASSRGKATVVSSHVEMPCTLSRSTRYWFMLEAIDPASDSTFWPRTANQPATTIAIRQSKSQAWHMNGAYGAMVRMYSE